MKRLILGLGLVALAAVSTACSGATAAPSDGPAASVPPGAVTIVAKDLAFSPTAVTVLCWAGAHPRLSGECFIG